MSIVTHFKGDVDYDSERYKVEIPAGETHIKFNVTIFNDNLQEGNEDFDLLIIRSSLPNRFTRRAPFRVTVTIFDDDEG